MDPRTLEGFPDLADLQKLSMADESTVQSQPNMMEGKQSKDILLGGQHKDNKQEVKENTEGDEAQEVAYEPIPECKDHDAEQSLQSSQQTPSASVGESSNDRQIALKSIPALSTATASFKHLFNTIPAPTREQNGAGSLELPDNDEDEPVHTFNMNNVANDTAVLESLFISDSGASCHVINDKRWFMMFREHKIPIGTGSKDAKLNTEGVGMVSISFPDSKHPRTNFILGEVFYIPNSPVNVISTSVLNHEFGMVSIYDQKLTITTKHGAEVVVGKKVRGLYRLRVRRGPPLCFNAGIIYDQWKEWKAHKGAGRNQGPSRVEPADVGNNLNTQERAAS